MGKSRPFNTPTHEKCKNSFSECKPKVYRYIDKGDNPLQKETSVKYKIPHNSSEYHLITREEVNQQGLSHGTYKTFDPWHPGLMVNTGTYKNGAEHGVFKQTEYYGPFLSRETGRVFKEYYWEGEKISRPIYWFNKNKDDLKTGNPKIIWNALFKSNEMTKAELDAPTEFSIKAQEKLDI